MDVQFVATVAVITADPPQSRKLFMDAIGLPLDGEGDGYYSSGNIPGLKHFGVWPLTEAAEACFGSPEWPADRKVPQASIEFDVEYRRRSRPRARSCGARSTSDCIRLARSRGARRWRGCSATTA